MTVSVSLYAKMIIAKNKLERMTFITGEFNQNDDPLDPIRLERDQPGIAAVDLEAYLAFRDECRNSFDANIDYDSIRYFTEVVLGATEEQRELALREEIFNLVLNEKLSNKEAFSLTLNQANALSEHYDDIMDDASHDSVATVLQDIGEPFSHHEVIVDDFPIDDISVNTSQSLFGAGESMIDRNNDNDEEDDYRPSQ